MFPHLSYLFLWVLCTSLTLASWLPRSHPNLLHHVRLHGNLTLSASSVSQNYTYTVPSPTMIEPSSTSQGMTVTYVKPVYEVCDTPGKNKSSCSTAFETITTNTCSTVLTYAFQNVTVTDCSQNITFSSQSSYVLATTTAPIQKGVVTTSPSPSMTTYVQSIVSYYQAPWYAYSYVSPNLLASPCELSPQSLYAQCMVQDLH